MSTRYRLSKALVWVANRLVHNLDLPHKAPYYRPVDTYMPGIGHKYSCGAYSYEGLKSLVEQDGPKGFGARATVKWLIGEDGWRDVADIDPKQLRRELAMSGIDMEDVES